MKGIGTFESPPRVAILDYGMGNLRSVENAFRKAGARPNLVADPVRVADYEALIFPGQGGIPDCMKRLTETGFDAVIRDWISRDKPFFGICLGLQALFDFSEEGDTPGLGVFPGKVKRFQLPAEYKIPQMGWNQTYFRETSPFLQNVRLSGDFFYYVHSYYVEPDDSALIWCESDYGGTFCAGVRKGNCLATQYHPEKSQNKGIQLYHNFLKHVVHLRESFIPN